MREPVAVGWVVRPGPHAGYEVLIWRDGEVLYRGFARSRRAAEELAQAMLRKWFPELFLIHEKEVA